MLRSAVTQPKARVRRCLVGLSALGLAAACSAAWTVQPASAQVAHADPAPPAFIFTTTTLTASPGAPQPGQTVTLTATVTAQSGSSAPPGSVNFSDGGSSLGSATLSTSGATQATATLQVTFPAGTHSLAASYTGKTDTSSNTIYNTSNGSDSLTVAAAATADATAITALQASPSTVLTGQSVTLTATVVDTAQGNAAVTSGDVQFKDGGSIIGDAVTVDGTTGIATFTWTGFTQGSHSITANYLGVSNTYEPSQWASGITVTANAPVTTHSTSVSLSAQPSTVTAGGSVTLTATVTDTTGSTHATSGAVQFYDNNLPIGDAVTVDSTTGIATLTWTGFGAGSHDITAKFAGNSTYDNSTSPAAGVTANAPPSAVATTITASISPNPIPNNGSATLTAHVQQVGSTVTPPQGSIVTFKNAANNSLIAQASLDSNGNGTVVKSGWQAGHYDIVATYVGDAANQSSSASFSADVRAVSQVTVTAPSPSIVYGDTLPTLTPSYSGFTNGDSVGSLSTPATCTTAAPTPAAVGSYAVSCSGASDTYYTFTYVPGTLAVAKAPLTLTPDSMTMRLGTSLPALTASLTGFVNGETLATSDVTGSPSCTTTATDTSPVGSYPITCTLGTLASNNYDITVGGQGTLQVVPATLTPAVATAWVGGPFPTGQPVTLYGSLFAGWLPLANQTLTMSLGSASCDATTNWIGLAQCTVVPTGPLGPTSSTVSFAGNGTYAASSDSRDALLYSFPTGGGEFVVGDVSAGDGGSVTFWGSQWSRSNELSHGDAPHSFKGFASQPGTPTAGASWSTGPGNSPSPPGAPLPSYMGVIVTRSVDQSGSSLGGSIANIVVVQTNDGYAPNPGHAGTGTIVAAVHQIDHAVLSRTSSPTTRPGTSRGTARTSPRSGSPGSARTKGTPGPTEQPALAGAARPPERLGQALVRVRGAGEDEQHVGDPVQVDERERVDPVRGVGLERAELRAAGDGARDVELCGGRRAAGQHEALQLGERPVEEVAEVLEPVDLRLRHAQPLVGARKGNREIGTEVEQLVLEPLERRPQRLGDADGERDPELRVELVHRAVGGDPRVELRGARAVAEARLAAVAPARVDAGQADRLVGVTGHTA